LQITQNKKYQKELRLLNITAEDNGLILMQQIVFAQFRNTVLRASSSMDALHGILTLILEHI